MSAQTIQNVGDDLKTSSVDQDNQPIKVPKKKVSGKRIVLYVLLGLVICAIVTVLVLGCLVMIAWFSLGSVLWDMAFESQPGTDCFSGLRQNRPWNYTLIDVVDYCPEMSASVDTSKLFGSYFLNKAWTSLVETVVFKSRDPDWVSSGKGNIYGTLILQPTINSTSKFVIVVHGIRSCRFTYAALEPATMLYRSGYSLLLLDMRNHGDSDRYDSNPYGSFGLYEHLDVLGGLDYLIQRYPFLNTSSPQVGLYGTSMGASTVLISFAQEKRFQVVFADSPPCSVYATLFFGAKLIGGSDGMAAVAMASAASVMYVKGKMGFPPLQLDPELLMKSVDLSGKRRIFLFQTKDDYIVPDFNQGICLDAARLAAQQQNVSFDTKVQYYMDEVTFPTGLVRSRSHCANHLMSMFVNTTKYETLLTNFFTTSL